MAELVDSNKPIDFITLKQALKDRAQLDEIGGPEYLSDLFSFVPSAANADYYIDIIREKYLLRQMIMTCNRVVSDCYDHREEVDALLDRVEQQIFSLTNYNVQIDLRPTKELVMDAIQEIEELYENRGSITGLPTGFVELDRMTSGLQPLNDLNANDTYNQNASADGPDKPRFKAPWRLNSDRVSPTTVTKKGHRSVSYRINLVFFGIPPRRML